MTLDCSAKEHILTNMPGPNRTTYHERRKGNVNRQEPNTDSVFATPELRIVRRVNFDRSITNNNNLLSDFLNEFGEMSYGEGITYSLGSMAVSYVTANEMGRMLSNKYRKVFGKDHPDKTRKLVMKTASAFRDFVGDEDKIVTKTLAALDNLALEAAFTEAQLSEGMIAFDPKVDLDVTRLNNNKLWQPAHFDIKGVEKYRGQYMGFDLVMPGYEAMQAERQYIISEFLVKDQKLDSRFIDKGFDPHAVFFRGFRPISQLALRYMDVIDQEILLEKPTAVVNIKK